MANPLLNALGGTTPQAPMPQGMSNMIQAFQQFKAGLTGDPQKQVQQLLASGRMSKEQYSQLASMAQGLMQILK